MANRMAKAGRVAVLPIIVLAAGAPMLLGFAGQDGAKGHWGRVARSGETLVGRVLGMRRAEAQDDGTALASYEQALSELKRDYYGDPVDAKKTRELTFAAIRGYLYGLNDPFTSFLDPDEWSAMRQTTRGDFDGIGARLETAGRDVRVMQAIPGTPAYRAGIKAGDIIYSVGTHDQSTGKVVRTTVTLGKDINDVVRLIKGPRGTMVTVSVLRKGEAKPRSFAIRREHIEPPVVEYWMEDQQNKIGHIALHEFNEKSDEQFDNAMKALEKQGMKALVFDLRYNPGGLLETAVDIGSRFVDSGPIVITQERSGQREEFPAHPPAGMKHFPMVVLINENSASAAEIVAGAIKDNRLGTLVGEHTFGKGLVQTLMPLGDGSMALRLTTQRWFTSKGTDISNKYDDEHRLIPNTGGVKPDVVVEQSKQWEDQAFDDKVHDTQLQRGLEILRTRLASARP